ncbi:Helix-turn-helix domain [Slackia heliotrinireducens]|uniref:Helix-turn-helix protein n=1 Tax=Slackia heliotrinireducens (strain ATCC 29202 / DSM 20476 / NCTC 11029 / RHS 1) TaxID=471855 RepID=C7N699_SLAHD|nr:helix-turn-helix transcriptional regulator [Slackia heliotrinireducens]ACV22434.1 Helix-turn-helix protein [Slackia heliotrinireducens DSM 20476]VEH00781.1 Helix-turn-helix domain [Slackia heliotrinireducens]
MREMTPTALSKYREARGMNRSDLARATGMQAGTIAWIETGRFVPYPSQLQKIADALDVDDPESLLAEIHEMQATS